MDEQNSKQDPNRQLESIKQYAKTFTVTSATADVIISQASRVSASESRRKVDIAQAHTGHT